MSLLERLKQTDRPESAGDSSQHTVPGRRVDDGRARLKQRIHETLINELGGELFHSDEDDAVDELRNRVRRTTFDLVDSTGVELPDQDK